MSETWVFPYLPFSYLGTLPIKKFEKIGCPRWGRSPNRSDFQFLVYFAPRRGHGGVRSPPGKTMSKNQKSENQIFCSGCLAGQAKVRFEKAGSAS